MNRWLRLLKHRWLDETDARRALDDAALARLADRVQQSERKHGGEIRLCIEASLPLSYLWRQRTARDRAVSLFGKMGVWDTEQNNGVLIYLLLAEHAIEIVADRAVARHVGPDQWQSLLARMRDTFRQGRFEAGLAEAVDAVDALLARHFELPAGSANPNELPDAPVRR